MLEKMQGRGQAWCTALAAVNGAAWADTALACSDAGSAAAQRARSGGGTAPRTLAVAAVDAAGRCIQQHLADGRVAARRSIVQRQRACRGGGGRACVRGWAHVTATHEPALGMHTGLGPDFILHAASCRQGKQQHAGSVPSESATSARAPRSSSSRTHSAWPYRAARCSGVSESAPCAARMRSEHGTTSEGQCILAGQVNAAQASSASVQSTVAAASLTRCALPACALPLQPRLLPPPPHPRVY